MGLSVGGKGFITVGGWLGPLPGSVLLLMTQPLLRAIAVHFALLNPSLCGLGLGLG